MTGRDEQPDLFGAKNARDEALERVALNAGPWRGRAISAVKMMPDGWTGTAEDLRLHLIHSGLDEPHHHNVWGELIKACIRDRVLLPTGERRNMRTIKSHARTTPVYRLHR